MARHEGRSGGAARSGVRQEIKQSANGLTCHKCGEVGHIRRNCHKGRSQGSAQSADGLAAVEAAVEIKQQRVEMPAL